MEALRLGEVHLLGRLEVALDELLAHANDVLAPVEPDHAQRLQRAHNVLRLDARAQAELLERHARLPVQRGEQDIAPVAPIAQLAEVRQGLLRRPHLLLPLRQLVGQRDEELAVAVALVGREGQDARQVVVLPAALLLWPITNKSSTGQKTRTEQAQKKTRI